MADVPPQILVEISTSSSTLARSSNPSFTITLKARVDASRPITLDTFQTVLSYRATALDYHGLTFQDTMSGKLVERRVVDVLYRVSDTLTANSGSVVEIPARNNLGSYTVQHTFQTPVPEQRALEPTLDPDDPEMKAIVKGLVKEMSDQTVGFEVEKTYEIGLGNHMSQVSWWKLGSKAEVFTRSSLSRSAEGVKLKLKLMKTARLTVVE